MQIVIDIDENVFTRLFDNGIEDYEIVNDDLFAIAQSIRNCTPLSAEPCEDAISRKAIKSHIENEYRQWGDDYDAYQILGDIEDFTSVRPIMPRGHWIESEGGIACSECGNEENSESSYCPWCGADMQESEG